MGLIDLSGAPGEVAALDLNLARDMANTLHATYPGHSWAVTCEGEKGIATVRNLALSGNWGFVLKLSGIHNAYAWKTQLVMAGGELLERFRLARGAVDWAAVASLDHDFSGKTLGDYAK